MKISEIRETAAVETRKQVGSVDCSVDGSAFLKAMLEVSKKPSSTTEAWVGPKAGLLQEFITPEDKAEKVGSGTAEPITSLKQGRETMERADEYEPKKEEDSSKRPVKILTAVNGGYVYIITGRKEKSNSNCAEAITKTKEPKETLKRAES